MLLLLPGEFERDSLTLCCLQAATRKQNCESQSFSSFSSGTVTGTGTVTGAEKRMRREDRPRGLFNWPPIWQIISSMPIHHLLALTYVLTWLATRLARSEPTTWHGAEKLARAPIWLAALATTTRANNYAFSGRPSRASLYLYAGRQLVSMLLLKLQAVSGFASTCTSASFIFVSSCFQSWAHATPAGRPDKQTVGSGRACHAHRLRRATPPRP